MIQDLHDEDEATLKESWATFSLLTALKTYWLPVVMVLLLPGIVSIVPISCPLGQPFRGCEIVSYEEAIAAGLNPKDPMQPQCIPSDVEIDNGILQNWAYYFVYNVIGWGGMWIKMVLWQCIIWQQPFFMPFMGAKPGIFALNRSLVAFIIPQIFSTCFFLAGYFIFNNPVPFGTISFGVPCFCVQFVAIYFFVVPKDYRMNFQDHCDIIRVLIPFVIWVVGLCCFVVLMWVLNYQVSQLKGQAERTVARAVCFLAMLIIRELQCKLPLEQLMGAVAPDLALLWRVAFKGTLTTFCSFLFAGMPEEWTGPIVLILINNLFIAWRLYSIPDKPQSFKEVAGLLLLQVCEITAPLAFMMLFAYNCFAFNKDRMYVMDKMSDADVVGTLYWNLVVIVLNTCRAVMVFRVVVTRRTACMPKVSAFGKLVATEWIWLLVWGLIAVCLACGVCMVMKQDGMDMSFSYKEWEGTHPF